MKKTAFVVLIFLLVIAIASGCSSPATNKGNTDAESVSAKESNEETITENTEQKTDSADNTTTYCSPEEAARIRNGAESALKVLKDNYGISPADFEKRFDEKLLFQISDKLNMTFGFEEYPKWPAPAPEVFMDVFLCAANCAVNGGGINFFYDTNDPEIIKRAMQDAHAGDNNSGENLCTFSMKKYNEFLKFYFGPEAPEFKTTDFETVAQAYKKGSLSFGYDVSEYCFQAYDAGDGDTMIYVALPTDYGCGTRYIYDVKEDGEDLTVYTVGGADAVGDSSDFHAFQESILYLSEITEEDEYVDAYIYHFGKYNGNVFLKSIERRCLFRNEEAMDCETLDDNVSVNLFYLPSNQDYERASLPKGSRVMILHKTENGKYEFVCPSGYGEADKSSLLIKQ